ncbi:molybdopterin-guanine dinucleotide biosynthesis protein B [Candidatus Bathyarchaeota archaeon]|nr:MAG: molybdopterin-guanine dinucleotide biosynthesis protein B [Candidatus Bathyarchaeota archaeon]
MMVPRAVAVVGFKNAGKTKVVEALVGELTRRGLRVGTLKHASRTHLLDTPGKDTMRHREAGAVASAILTSEGAAVFLSHPIPVEEAVARLGPVDIVVLEGFKSLDTVARIVVPRDAGEVEELANGLEIVVTGPAAENLPDAGIPVVPLTRVEELADIIEVKAFPLLPGLDCGGCGYESCGDLARAILAGEAKMEKCVNRSAGAVRLRVDGRALALKPFVQKAVRNVVLGMVRTLKGGEDPRRVEVAFDVGGEEDG